MPIYFRTGNGRYLLPCHFGAAAAQRGLVNRTESHNDALPYYDIRSAAQTKEGGNASDLLAAWRDKSGKSAVAVADLRDSFVRGEEMLKARVPTLKVDYNLDIRTPEMIGADVKIGSSFLTGPTAQSRVRNTPTTSLISSRKTTRYRRHGFSDRLA